MSVIDVELLTGPVSADAPAGVDVEYDPAYLQLETLAAGTPESVMGDEIKPAVDPDWRAVKTAALKLFERTRDLRVALILATALLKEDGLDGFRDGVAVVRGFIEHLWDQFYPRLDPADNNDPTVRVNILTGFEGDPMGLDVYKFKLRLREAPLTHSQQKIGRFGFRDLQIARGEIPPPAGKADQPAPKPADAALINAAFADTPIADLSATKAVIQDCFDHFSAIDAALTAQLPAGVGPDLTGIKTVLGQLRGVMDVQLSKRGITVTKSPDDRPDLPTPTDSLRLGAINSRVEVVRALDLICAYYDRHEPASPVPMFMQRAKRLVTMNFVDLIKDLAPEAMPRIEVFKGADPGGESAPTAPPT